MSKNNYRDKVIIRRRMIVVFTFVTVLFFILFGRLSYIMIFNSKDYSAKAVEQWTSEVKIDAKRGRILDRNGEELAISANVYRVDLDMNALRQYLKKNNLTNEEIAPKLSSAIGMDMQEILKILNKTLPNGQPMQSANVKRRIEKEQANKVSDLKIGGVLVSPDTKRYYPNNNLLSHVLGCTNVDGAGLTGLELYYNKELTGVPGIRIAEIDRRSSELPYTISEYTKPIEGRDVMITIDKKIQSFAEKAAEQALIDNKAKAVSVVVMDPKTGEIYALANKPDFNPNNPKEDTNGWEELQKKWRNRSINDTYEPGSIFKVVTAIAAMEEGLISDSDKFVCNGSTKVANRTIRCWKTSGHGVQVFPDILKNSCNVGFINVGQKLGAEKLNKYIKLFGFGQKTGVDLPGEAKGIVKKTESINDVDLATISFGQTNTVNPIQFLAAFNTIANNGVWIRPHIMKEIAHQEGESKITDKVYNNLGERRVVSEENTRLLRTYLERVIAEGSGKRTYIEGYHIAGKTGTAQKVNPLNGTYERGKYVSSFVGMAPANDPKVTVFISIDEASAGEYYAGVIATPVAKQVFNDIFNYMSFKADVSEEQVNDSMKKDVMIPEVRGMKKEDALKVIKFNNLNFELDGDESIISDMSPKPGYTVKEGSKIILYTGAVSNYNKEVVVPDLRGYTKEGALKILKDLGLKVEINGEGLVSEQSIPPNGIAEKGTVIKLILSSSDVD